MKILFVTDTYRDDTLYFLKDINLKSENILLWFDTEKQKRTHANSFANIFSKEIFWNHYLTPKGLLRKIKPDKIVFVEMIDQLQIALIIAANYYQIPTFFIDHGAAGCKETAIKRSENIILYWKKRTPYLLKRFIFSFNRVVRVKIFYFSTFYMLKRCSSFLKFFQLPLLMLFYKPNLALSICRFRERVPKCCIIFSRANFKEIQHYTGIAEKDIIITGVPFFDHYSKSDIPVDDHITYIEHPMLEEQLFDWTQEHHKKIAISLFNFANSRKVKIFIKLHPRSNINIWHDYQLISPYFEVIQFGDFTELFLSSKLILGYSSSLLTGFLSIEKNVVNLGWHPYPQIHGPDLSSYGICHKSLDYKEIEKKYGYWISTNLCTNNKEKHQEFLQEYNYPFDGKATERVYAIINA